MIALVNGQGTVIQQQEFVSVHSEGFLSVIGPRNLLSITTETIMNLTETFGVVLLRLNANLLPTPWSFWLTIFAGK